MPRRSSHSDTAPTKNITHHVVALATIAAGITAGCATLPAHKQADIDRMQAARANAKSTQDPDVKAYWKGLAECHNDNEVRSMQELAKGSTSDHRKCADKNASKALGALRARAARETNADARARTERIASCIDLFDTKGSFSPFESMNVCVERFVAAEKAEKEEARATASLQKEYDDVMAQASPDAWLAFLKAHPKDSHSPAVAKRVLGAAATMEGERQATLDEQLATAYPAAVPDIPTARRLMLVGPRGMRVRDLQKMNAAKISPNVIVARVRASSEPYKDFDADELTTLKQLGIPDDVVTAMIEVTTKLVDKRKADEERQALRAELAALKKMIEEKQASGEKTSGQVVQTKEGPMDSLASCAKRLGAMKLCDQIPFPGSTICASTAESSFPCPNQP